MNMCPKCGGKPHFIATVTWTKMRFPSKDIDVYSNLICRECGEEWDEFKFTIPNPYVTEGKKESKGKRRDEKKRK